MSRENVIFLTIDTLRPDRLGCYGFIPSITPNIDQLAEKGIRFTQGITGGSWTQAAFPVMFTSTYASMHGGCLGPLSPERPSPLQALADNGYATAGFSTSPLLSRSYGYETIFEHFVDLTPGEKDPWLRSAKGGHHLLTQPATHFISNLMGIKTRPAKIYSSASEITDEICRWIESVNSPFFIWAHYMDVHWPYHLEDELVQPSQIAQAWRDVVHLHNANWNGAVITPDQRDRYIDLYEQAIAYTDHQIGRLFSFLVDQGLDRNTIIVLVSDHGEELLDHGRWGHWEDNLFDEILKVPLIIYLPDRDKKVVIDDQVRTLDLMPTVLDLCECPSPPGMKGSSLVPLWEADSGESDPRIAISEMWRDSWHIIAVRTDKYKYIWDNRRPEKPLLFDLEVDQEEKKNLAFQSPEVVSDLHRHVEMVLDEMEKTKSEQIESPELDEEMLGRLRDLGYVQ